MANPKEDIKDKLKYLSINLENIPENIQNFEPLDFMVLKGYEETQYKQYRYIPIKEIQILLSPTNRMDEIEKKYKKASPIAEYLDNKNEENIIKHATFLKMLKTTKVDEIEKIAEEQKELNKKIPFKVKYEGNYLWQIYYAENTDRYFMLVPTEDADYSTFFYILKKQLENRNTGKIFVPIRNVDYSNKYLKRREYEDIENYLWLFTKDWPLIYDVFDKSNNMSIQIVGETEVYEKIKSPYKIKLQNKEEANKFYKLLKALFIIQTELPHFFKFRTNINKAGGIEFYYENEIIEYTNISQFINQEYEKSVYKKEETSKLAEKYRKKLNEKKLEAINLELEYLTKEKQISTYLECKKTFFGKVKYYFKYSKKKPPKRQQKIEKQVSEESVQIKKETKKIKKGNYTIEELIKIYKEYEIIENEMKNLLMDINAIKLKNKNMKKKIENATSFIEEIDNHKKSIFEFWKYSNKDEVAALAEGEEEEVDIIKKVTKSFDYEQDLEKFGEKLDAIQRRELTNEEMDSIYITTTNQLEILNKVKNSKIIPKDIEISLKKIKKELKEEKILMEEEEFDIFGGLNNRNARANEINNKKHREIQKNKFKILEINKNSKQIGYKLTLERILENINKALEKIELQEDIIVYKAVEEGKLDKNEINIFEMNPKKELNNAIHEGKSKIILYKIMLKKGTKIIGYTNSIYYENKNKTLPIGMDIESKILVDTNKLNLEQTNKQKFKMLEFEDPKKDFTVIKIKTINVMEYKEKEEE